MSITARCGACQKAYKVSDDFAGKKVRCKNCGEVFQVPKVIIGVPVDDAAPSASARPAARPPAGASPTSRPRPGASATPGAQKPKATPPVAKPAPKPAKPAKPAPAADDPFAGMDDLLAMEQSAAVDESVAPAYTPPAKPRRALAAPPPIAEAPAAQATPPAYRPPPTLGYFGPSKGAPALSGNSAAVRTLVGLVLPILLVLLGWGIPTALQIMAVIMINHPVIYLVFVIQQGLFFGILLNGTTYGVQMGSDNAKFNMPEYPRLKVLAIMCSWGLTAIIVALCLGIGLTSLAGPRGPSVAGLGNALVSMCVTTLLISLGVGYILFKLFFECTWVQALVGYLFLIIFFIISAIAAGITNYGIMLVLGKMVRATMTATSGT